MNRSTTPAASRERPSPSTIASATTESSARLRAAAHERAGNDGAALGLYERVRADGDPPQQLEALRGALRLQTREGAYAPVVELANALLARPEVPRPCTPTRC